jgi:hypothetical protein
MDQHSRDKKATRGAGLTSQVCHLAAAQAPVPALNTLLPPS